MRRSRDYRRRWRRSSRGISFGFQERRTFTEASGFGGYAVPIRDQLVGDVREPLYLLQAGVLLVLLIACANVANLLLMRVSDRQRELAIRSTLGAGSGRLTRQLLIESVVLSAGGAIVGLALGMAGARALLALTARELPAQWMRRCIPRSCFSR